jgi:hypothetical protein
MAYTQGGLIEATDYNNLAGSNTSVDGTSINSVWAWGANSRGYGQTPISSVASTAIVTATQWASLINTLNSANTHINGSSSGLTANTAGQIIGHSGGLQTKINGINSDRRLFASNSAVVANHNNLTAYAAWTSTSTTATLTRSFGANIAFGSPDKARFFFNAGGRLKFNITATADAVARSVAAKAAIDNLGGLATFGSNINGGRTGSGGTVGTNNTAIGYYQLGIANVTIVSITSTTTSYTSDTATITARTNGTKGSFNDNGDIISIWATINSTQGTGAVSLFDSLSVTPTVTVDVSYPETTNLSNTWGAVIVTRQGS